MQNVCVRFGGDSCGSLSQKVSSLGPISVAVLRYVVQLWRGQVDEWVCGSVIRELCGGYMSRTQLLLIARVCLCCLWVSWHYFAGFWVGCASCIYGTKGSQAKG